MKIIKQILISLGILFLLFVALFVYLAHDSSKFLNNHKEFVESFSYNFSENWDIDDVYEELSVDFIKSLREPGGRDFLNKIHLLGKLMEISDIQMGNYSSTTEGKTGEIIYKAKFQNANAVVTIVLIEKEGKPKVQSYHVSTTEELSPVAKEHEA